MSERIPDHVYQIDEARRFTNAARVERLDERNAPNNAEAALHAAGRETYTDLAADALKKVQANPQARAAFASVGSTPETVAAMLGQNQINRASATLDAVHDRVASAYWQNVASQGRQGSGATAQAETRDAAERRGQGLGR